MNTIQTNLACNLNAHTPEQRVRHRELLTGILAKKLEVHEQVNGYTITLPAETSLIAEVAEYINLERLCCPSLYLNLTCEANHSPLVLEISGADGPTLWAILQAAIQ
jgi:hypothetical protein